MEIIALLFFEFPYVSSSSFICSTPRLLAGYDVISLDVYGSICLYIIIGYVCCALCGPVGWFVLPTFISCQ